MRLTGIAVLAVAIFGQGTFAQTGSAQPDSGFTGTWKLNTGRSEINPLPFPPAPFLRVERNGTTLSVFEASSESDVPASNVSAGKLTEWQYPLDRREVKQQVRDSSSNVTTFTTTTKWEGSALLVTTIASGPQNYSLTEVWRASRDGNALTIRRTYVRIRGEDQSILIYENVARQRLAIAANSAQSTSPATVAQNTSVSSPAQERNERDHSSSNAPASSAAPVQESRVFRPDGRARPAPPPAAEYVVEAGSRILLRLTNAVDTKHTGPGDRIYLETAAPVFVDQRLIIPRGSLVMGTVTESQRAGRVKGLAALNLRFDKLTLPNGVTRDFRSRAGSVETAGNVERSEGKIKGEDTKGRDAKTVGATTAAGAGIGAIAGGAAGAGIGAAIGAAAGLGGVLGTRGKDLVLPQGATMEMVLDRELRFTEDELP